MAAVAGQVGEGLRHEGRAQAVLLGDGLDHELEERVAVGGDQRVVVQPVHLELAIGVLVVVLVRPPAELEHGIADRGDHLVAAHQRRLVVAGLVLGVARVRDRGAVGQDDEVLALDPGLHPVALLGGGRDLALEHDPRRARDLLAGHPQIGGEPGDLGLPGQPGQAARDRGSRTCRDRPASCRARWRSRQSRRPPSPCRRSPRPGPASRAARRTGRRS